MNRPLQVRHVLRPLVLMLGAWQSSAGSVYSADCQGDFHQTSSSCRCERHCCRHHCCACEPPHGVVLPSAPALFFGASTLSVVPAGLSTQNMGTNRNLSESDLALLLKLMQAQQPQGASTCSGSAPSGIGAAGQQGAGAATPRVGSGLSIEARLAQAEADIRTLQEHIRQHTDAIAEIVIASKDPELMKKVLQVSP